MAEQRILLVNDNQEISSFLAQNLTRGAGYALEIKQDPQAAVEASQAGSFEVVMIKSDMPHMDLNKLVGEIKKADPDAIIIILAQKETSSLLREISRLDIYDLLTTPINEEKLLFLVKKGAELHSLATLHRRLSVSLKEQNVSLQKQNILLANRVEDSTKNLTRLYEDLRSTYMRTIKVLAQAIDARDHYTHSHSENVAKYAVAVAEEMHLSARDIELIREACELHDLGKIGIQDNILVKPSALNPVEWEIMKKHPLTGAKILEPLTFLHGVIDLIRQHHEHYDGSGYPQGLKGDEILLGARIIHLADAYEAMTSARAYRKIPLSKQEAIAEINRKTGTQFDPKVTQVFLKVVDKV